VGIFCEYAREIALTRSLFSVHIVANIIWQVGSALTLWGSLQRSPRPLSWIKGPYL